MIDPNVQREVAGTLRTLGYAQREAIVSVLRSIAEGQQRALESSIDLPPLLRAQGSMKVCRELERLFADPALPNEA